MRRLRASLLVLLLLGIPILRSQTAYGLEKYWGNSGKASGHIIDGTPAAIVVTGPAGKLGSWASGSGGPRWTCGYYTARGDAVLGLIAADEPSGTVTPIVDVTYFLLCDDANGDRVFTDLVTYDPADPLGTIAATERAAQMAVRQLSLTPPQLKISPPAGSDQIVGVATWLWVADPWTSTSASATLGGVTATVTAVPRSVTFEMGDGATVTCAPGTPYDTTRPAHTQSTECSHTYIHAGNFTIRATLTWDVSWTASTGEGDTLGSVTRTTQLPVHVVEIQAMIH